jgi:hypothetical protein
MILLDMGSRSATGSFVELIDQGHPAVGQFRRWLAAGLAGCWFASRFAKGDRLRFYFVLDEPSEDLAIELDGHFDRAADYGSVPIALFPRIRDASGTARLVKLLRKGVRWSAKEIPWRHHPREQDACLVGLEWITSAGLRSQVMGFAPLGAMPVTRRSPYVAVAAWPGGHDNEFFARGHPQRVSFADAATKLRDREQHDDLWRKSEITTRQLSSDPADDVERMRKVAFCLPRAELMAEDPGFFDPCV